MQRQSMTTVGGVVCVCVRIFSDDILKGGIPEYWRASRW